jgi:hypothetical protein
MLSLGVGRSAPASGPPGVGCLCRELGAERLRRRELQHAPRTLPRAAQSVEEARHVLRGLVRLRMAGRDDQDGAFGRLREAGNDQAAGRSPEPAGGQTQFSLGEGVGEVPGPQRLSGRWNSQLV